MKGFKMGFMNSEGKIEEIPKEYQEIIEHRDQLWIDRIKEIDNNCGVVLDKLALTEKALELACEILRDFTGNCPYDQFNLDMPNDCDEQCEEQMKKYFCWDKYLVNRAKEMTKSE